MRTCFEGVTSEFGVPEWVVINAKMLHFELDIEKVCHFFEQYVPLVYILWIRSWSSLVVNYYDIVSTTFSLGPIRHYIVI